MVSNTLKKYIGFHFSSGSVPGKDYISFQTKMRNDLKKQAVENDLEMVRFLRNHYEFSAVLKNIHNGSFVYVSIPDVRFYQDEWINETLVRSMKHEKDWTGGANQFSKWEDIGLAAKKISETERFYK